MIGIVGGLGVGAGVHYYKELAAAHDAIGKPLELVMIHAQMKRIFEYASTGAGSEEQHRGLTVLAKTLCARDGVDAVLLAGTDLSAVFNEANTDFPHLDCARVHIQAIMRAVN